MRLLLVRHAHAVDEEENPDRPLSRRGRAQVAKLVTYFRVPPRLSPTEIWHSPLLRSLETAELLADGLRLGAPLIEKPGLQPEDDPRPLLKILKRHRADIMIVGHEPHLSELTAWLVDGEPTERFGFKKGGVLALERSGTTWEVQWKVSPADVVG
jgi:phosphohistidine phosphatase